ncbi:putative GMC oxidoreductase [Xylariomycetidae sp. FL2044]|nr:putative GMC oxidoreductase [Xylariomycetidae sp. FL2044]
MASSFSPDYIIIGGGTSGLVVANRLSENPDVKVLVLEAGKDFSTDPRVNVPALWTSLLGSEVDWTFKSVPQSAACNRTFQEPQGKLLGGSSAINGQAFIAPSQYDFDAWAKLGNPGWDWASLVPTFKRAYTLIPPPDQATRDHLGLEWISDEYRGTSGPVKVSFPGVIQNPLAKAWVDTFRGMKKATTADLFSGNSIGGYSNTATVDPEHKVRSYAYPAYGIAARERPNVRILTEAKVQRISFASTDSGLIRTTGVVVMVGDKVEEIFAAEKEVIIAAGVFNTPKLLELSGVGDKNLLERHGIEVKIDLPGVGENFQDHLMIGMSYEVTDGIVTGDPLLRGEPEALVMAQKLYVENKAGPFTFGGVQSHAFMSTANIGELLDSLPQARSPNEVEHYDIVRSLLESPESTSGAWFMFLAQANLHEAGDSFVGTQFLPGNFASLGCVQSHPFSRGCTHISSADADAAPVIDPRYLSHPADLEIMARHLQSVETILRYAEPLASFFKPDGQRNHPDSFHVGDLEIAKKYILDTAVTDYHGCGTAAMKPREKGGVVNPELTVYGTENLRVVDASIFPLIPRSNTQSSVYAVAEKAADIIKGAS